MTVTVRQLAECVRGEVLGDGDLPISHARPLSDAQPGDITFIDGERNLQAWHACPAAAAIAPETIPVNGRPLIRVRDPLMAFAQVVERLHGRAADPVGGIDPTARVHPTATVDPGATVDAFVVVGEGSVIAEGVRLHAGVVVGKGCRVGADTVLHPRVVLYDDTIIGTRVVIHANAVIGADGFGYRVRDGRHVKVPQLGWVEIGDDVEVGAGSTIDRGTFGATRVGAGTKIDNQVMIGHNCQIGKHNILAGQVGIAGSCSTGDYVVMGGQVGVADHLTIGDGAILAAQTGVTHNVPAGARMIGFPARPEGPQKRVYVVMQHLPELRKDVNRIKHQLGLDGE